MRVSLTALLAGVVIGLTAFGVKHAIAIISRFVTSTFNAFESNVTLLFLGVASIMVSGFIVRKIVRRPLEHATDRIKTDLADGRAPLPRRLMIAPVAVNAVTLGLGGSAGAEGPIAYTGAAIASRMARWLGLSQLQMMRFLACGAGAGIAAIFKAPVGGFFFTVEVLRYPLDVNSTLLLAAICLISGLTAYAAGGFVSDMPFTSLEHMGSEWYPAIVALGVVCGLYSIYYDKIGNLTASKLESINRPWVRNLIAGTALGLCLFLFPSLYGEGYGVLGKVLNGNIAVVTEGTLAHGFGDTATIIMTLIGILALKSVATYSTNSGGGVAGEFAPTIFAGGMVGALFVICTSMIPDLHTIPSGNFMAMAMAAVMAGTIKAPLMAIFIVTEMTMAPTLLLPVSLCSAISYTVANLGKLSKTKQ